MNIGDLETAMVRKRKTQYKKINNLKSKIKKCMGIRN
jgi:hypothetical protein